MVLIMDKFCGNAITLKIEGGLYYLVLFRPVPGFGCCYELTCVLPSTLMLNPNPQYPRK